MKLAGHTQICLKESVELSMDSAAVHFKLVPRSVPNTKKFPGALCEISSLNLAGKQLGYVGVFCKGPTTPSSESSHCTISKGDFPDYIAHRFKQSLSEVVADDKQMLVGDCPCAALRCTFAHLLRKWTVERGACCAQCSSCVVLAVGSHIFFAHTGSMRAIRSSRRMKKINVTHDTMPEGDYMDPRVIDFFVESSIVGDPACDLSFMVIVSDAVWRRVFNMEVFDVVRTSLLSNKDHGAKRAAKALIDYVIAKSMDDDPSMDEYLNLTVVVVVWTRPVPA